MPLKISDSTTIGLGLSVLDWARSRKTKGGILLHIMYDSKEQLPKFMIFCNAIPIETFIQGIENDDSKISGAAGMARPPLYGYYFHLDIK